MDIEESNFQPSFRPAWRSPASVRAARAIHPTAKAIINGIVARGGVVTSAHAKAIDAFIRAEIGAGRWGIKIKRMNFCSWAVAAANSLGWVSGTSGTFVAGVSHASAGAIFDGTSGYYNSNQSFGADGLTSSNGYMFYISPTYGGLGATQVMGSGAAGNVTQLGRGFSANTIRLRYSGTTTGQIEGSGSLTGVVSASRISGLRSIWRRGSEGRVLVASSSAANSGSIVSAPVVVGAFNNTDSGLSPTGFSNCTLTAWGWGLDMTSEEDEAFTANLKTLYQVLTGSMLPA